MDSLLYHITCTAANLSLNYSDGIGIGIVGFWIQANILVLELFLQKLSDEKKEIILLPVRCTTDNSTAEVG
jgi:hypothetical protein